MIRSATGESVCQIDTDGQPVTALSVWAAPFPGLQQLSLMAEFRFRQLRVKVLLVQRHCPYLPLHLWIRRGGQTCSAGSGWQCSFLAVAADTGLASGPVQLPAEAGPASRLDSDGTVLATLSGQKVELWKAEDNSRMAAMDLPAAVADFSLNTVTDRLAVQLADGQLCCGQSRSQKQLRF